MWNSLKLLLSCTTRAQDGEQYGGPTMATTALSRPSFLIACIQVCTCSMLALHVVALQHQQHLAQSWIAYSPKLQPLCSFHAKQGIVTVTDNKHEVYIQIT